MGTCLVIGNTFAAGSVAAWTEDLSEGVLFQVDRRRERQRSPRSLIGRPY